MKNQVADLKNKVSEIQSIEKYSLSSEERDILSLLATAYNKFLQLKTKHPDDDLEFKNAIHDAQKLISLRVARRVNSEIWALPPS